MRKLSFELAKAQDGLKGALFLAWDSVVCFVLLLDSIDRRNRASAKD